MIKKKLFKYGSVFMCAAVMAMSLMACGSNTQQSSNQDSKAVQYSATSSDSSELENVIKTQLLTKTSTNVSSSDDDSLKKDETVYVFSKANGNQDHIIVTEKLKNRVNQKSIKDISGLKDIKNLSGDEKSTSGSGNQLTWDADGNSITYQGTTTKQAPVDIKVTYYLDGKEISPDELAGKSGKVRIRFDYTNNEKKTVTINGEQKEICVPFTMVTGLMLPGDNFKNVKVTNGKVSEYSKGNIALGVTLPGLKDSLDLKFGGADSDIDIPDYFEVTADVTDFELDATMTVATSNLFTDVDIDKLTLDDLKSQADQLQDGSNQLMDGSSKLADGSAALADGANSLNNGAGQLSNGLGELAGKVPTLTNGISQLNSGAGQLSDGLGQLAGKVPALTSGISQLNSGAGQLSDGLGQLAGQVPALTGGVSQLNDGAKAAAAGAGSLNSGLQSLASNFKGDGTEENPGVVNGMASLASGSDELKQGIAKLSGSLTSSFGQIKAQADEYGKNSETLKTAQTLENGIGAQVNATLQSINANLVITPYSELSKANANTSDEQVQALYLKYIQAYQFAVSNADNQTITAINNTLKGMNVKGATSLQEIYQSEMGLLIKTISNQSISGALTNVYNTATTTKDPQTGLNLSQSLTALQNGADNLSTGIKKVQAGIGTLDELNAQSPVKQPTTVCQALNALIAGSGQLKDGTASLSAGTGTLNSSAGALVSGVNQLSAGAENLKNGTGSLNAGAGDLASGVNKLNAGAKEVKNGTESLNAGAGTLASGVNQLNNGAKQLSSGAGTLASGAATLNEGAITLKDGTIKFNNEGINKITSLVGDDAQSAVDTLKQIMQAGKDYQSFAGKSDDISGSVTFIYKTDGINK